MPKLNPDYNEHGYPPEFVAYKKRLHKRVPTTVQHDLIRMSRLSQSIKGQSQSVEQHMNLMKPTRQIHPEPTLAPDRADNWKRPDKVDVNLTRAYRDAQLRKRLQQLANEGAFDDEI